MRQKIDTLNELAWELRDIDPQRSLSLSQTAYDLARTGSGYPNKGVIIIAVSASVFEREKQQAFLAGYEAFLPKPVQLENLLSLLSTHLKVEWLYDDRPEGQKASRPVQTLN